MGSWCITYIFIWSEGRSISQESVCHSCSSIRMCPGAFSAWWQIPASPDHLVDQIVLPHQVFSLWGHFKDMNQTYAHFIDRPTYLDWFFINHPFSSMSIWLLGWYGMMNVSWNRAEGSASGHETSKWSTINIFSPFRKTITIAYLLNRIVRQLWHRNNYLYFNL